MLLLPMMPTPKFTAAPPAYPLPLVSFHRNELLFPWIHMPPHAAAGVPFRTATLFSTLICDDVGPTRIPDMQLVDVVTPCTHPRTVALNKFPSSRNRCTIPGPRIPTLLCAFVFTPASVPTFVPLHPVVGSFGPVIEKPFKLAAELRRVQLNVLGMD
jgi:hypothetical protein